MLNQLIVAAFAVGALAAAPASVASSTTCNGKTYKYQNLAGYGYVPYDTRDSRKDTIGGIGSSAAIDKNSWTKIGKDKFQGTLYGLPDRGFNVLGTMNYQPRIHKFKLTLDASRTTGSPNNTNIKLDYLSSIFLYDPSGKPMTGLDGDVTPGAHSTFPGFPDLPIVHINGDGFGDKINQTSSVAVPLDSEGLVLNGDGSFWISDEYGPYVYKFDKNGKMIQAIRPPNAIIPIRKGNESFSADSPPIYAPDVHPSPGNPTSGRQNNQGLEGLTASPDGKTLYTLVQSALRQDGGDGGSSARYYTRFLVYDATKSPAKPTAEYVVRLPQDAKNSTAAQSEIHYVSDTQFLVLARDSGNGVGLGDKNTNSTYRSADVFDISKATNILGKYDDINGTIVSNFTKTVATLKTGITTAEYCKFLNFNNNTELKKFGLHNGGAQDAGLLNEKWEGFALLPVLGKDFDKRGETWGDDEFYSNDDQYFLFALSDNDFRAIDVYVNNGTKLFHDTVNAQNQVLAFQVQLPKNSRPLLG